MSILVLRCTTLNIFWEGRVCESMLCYLLVIIMAKWLIQRLNPVDLRYLFTWFVALKLFYVRFYMLIEYIVTAWCMTDCGHNSAEYRFFFFFAISLVSFVQSNLALLDKMAFMLWRSVASSYNYSGNRWIMTEKVTRIVLYLRRPNRFFLQIQFEPFNVVY